MRHASPTRSRSPPRASAIASPRWSAANNCAAARSRGSPTTARRPSSQIGRRWPTRVEPENRSDRSVVVVAVGAVLVLVLVLGDFFLHLLHVELLRLRDELFERR